MGVAVKMVTGDALAIAQETARKLGMGTNILDASRFGDTKSHETALLSESIEEADGFAQVFPEHKFHIVDVLQQRGHIVGIRETGERRPTTKEGRLRHRRFRRYGRGARCGLHRADDARLVCDRRRY